MTNEIDDAEIDAAVRLMEELVAAVGEQAICYGWDQSGALTLVTPVNPQKETE
jgi:microsomal dipeptidase-like Zn-dependent dipeptidase